MRSGVIIRRSVDQENVARLETELASLARRHKTLSWVRITVFVFLYASVLSNFALPALTDIVKTFTLVANLVGVGILSLAALYLTWRLAQLWNRMVVIGSNVIAIYEKHNVDVYEERKGKVSRITKKR
jgi:hypothetical protein